jgi:hypothetical protein
VIVTDLVVRSAPGVGEDSAILQDERLTDGDWVYVVEGPITVDGYDWLLAVELEDPFSGEVQSAGWIAAASREGEEWVVPVDPICPSEISVEAFAAVAEGLLLYCFGGQELTLEGAFGFCFHSDPVIQEPAWLGNYPCAFEKLDRPRVSHWPTVSVHLHPDADVHASPEAGPLRITGRFDAPEAKTCRYVDGAELTFPEFHAALLPFQCRASFVVESTTPISR